MEKNPLSNSTVTVTDPNTKFKISYSMNNRLKKNLDGNVIPSLHKKDKDYVIAIDGREGSGKSTFAFQLGKYVDPTLNLSRVVFSPEEFREAVFKAKKGECIIYDEAFTGFSSRASLSPVNKVLVSLMMQMRQKNLCVIIVLPTFFLLDKYVALYRARILVHVFENRGVRGYFRIYNTRLKKLLYIFGKKTISYNPRIIKTRFKGRFYGKFALGDEEIEKKYRKLKEKALIESEKTPMTSAQVKYKEQRDILLWRLRKELKMTYQEMQNYLEEFDFIMNYSQIRNICVKLGDKGDEILKKEEKTDKNEEKPAENEENNGNLTEKPEEN